MFIRDGAGNTARVGVTDLRLVCAAPAAKPVALEMLDTLLVDELLPEKDTAIDTTLAATEPIY